MTEVIAESAEESIAELFVHENGPLQLQKLVFGFQGKRKIHAYREFLELVSNHFQWVNRGCSCLQIYALFGLSAVSANIFNHAGNINPLVEGDSYSLCDCLPPSFPGTGWFNVLLSCSLQ
jgi:hypothetical protein